MGRFWACGLFHPSSHLCPSTTSVQKLPCLWGTGICPALAHTFHRFLSGTQTVASPQLGPLGPSSQAPHLRTRLLLGLFRLWCPLVSRPLRKPARVAAASQQPWSPGSEAALRQPVCAPRPCVFFPFGVVVTECTHHRRPLPRLRDEGKVSRTSLPSFFLIQTAPPPPMHVTWESWH